MLIRTSLKQLALRCLASQPRRRRTLAHNFAQSQLESLECRRLLSATHSSLFGDFAAADADAGFESAFSSNAYLHRDNWFATYQIDVTVASSRYEEWNGTFQVDVHTNSPSSLDYRGFGGGAPPAVPPDGDDDGNGDSGGNSLRRPPADEYLYDIFLSHALADKKDFVDELAQHLSVKHNLRVWYDSYILRSGNSITNGMSEGINNSEYAVVVLSESYFSGSSTVKEFRAIAARETTLQRDYALPVWYGVNSSAVAVFDAHFVDKFAYRNPELSAEDIADRIAADIQHMKAA